MLDSSIVGVMLPSMRTDLHLGAGAQAWIVAIYLLTLAVLLPIGGRLCDALGAARTFAVGMAGFTVASAGVGLSTAGVEIIAWRGFAGCAAALMMPAGLAMIAEVVPEDRRPGALAVYTGVGQAFATVGPLVGGLCAQYLGWRWGFLVNVPVGIAGLVLLALARPATPRHPGRVLLDLGLFRIRPFAAAAAVLFALGFAMTRRPSTARRPCRTRCTSRPRRPGPRCSPSRCRCWSPPIGPRATTRGSGPAPSACAAASRSRWGWPARPRGWSPTTSAWSCRRASASGCCSAP